MTDIVERLRGHHPPHLTDVDEALHDEAADEIERLRDKLFHIAQHPNTPELIKQYAKGMLDN